MSASAQFASRIAKAAELKPVYLIAGGFELGAYDFAWLVMERFPGQPVGNAKLEQSDVWSLFEVAAEFHAAAVLERPVDTTRCPADPDWRALLARAERQVEAGSMEHPGRWRSALAQVQEALPELLARWAARPIDTWCHRDIHAHNAMRRASHARQR